MEHLLQVLGPAGAEVLQKHLTEIRSLELPGTSISAVVDAVQPVNGLAMKLTQLVGAQGAKNAEYDGHALVSRRAEKLEEKGNCKRSLLMSDPRDCFINAGNPGHPRDADRDGQGSGIALVGIGTTETQGSSFFLSGLKWRRSLPKFARRMLLAMWLVITFQNTDGSADTASLSEQDDHHPLGRPGSHPCQDWDSRWARKSGSYPSSFNFPIGEFCW